MQSLPQYTGWVRIYRGRVRCIPCRRFHFTMQYIIKSEPRIGVAFADKFNRNPQGRRAFIKQSHDIVPHELVEWIKPCCSMRRVIPGRTAVKRSKAYQRTLKYCKSSPPLASRPSRMTQELPCTPSLDSHRNAAIATLRGTTRQCRITIPRGIARPPM